MNRHIPYRAYLLIPCSIFIFLLSSCKFYSFTGVSIEKEAKTVRVNYIDNRARYVNAQLSPQLTNRLRQKINNQTRLTPIQSEEADYDISGWVSDYTVTTSGISNQQAAVNRLTVTVNIIFKNRVAPERNFETQLSRNFDFSASLTLSQAEAQLGESIVRNMVDEIFNRIFSDW
jgi:Lipopolysaccharide-assembly